MMYRKSYDAIGNFIRDKVLIYEYVMLLIIFFVYMGKLAHLPFINEVILMVFLLFSVIYFFSSFQSFNPVNISKFDSFFVRLCGWASSIALLGIVSNLMKIESYREMLLIGSVSLIIVLIYILYQKSNNPENVVFNKWVIIRCVMLISIAVSILINN